LTGIEASVSEINDRVSEIAGSAKEQSSGIAEINVAVNQLDQVTQQNAAMFEQTNAATQSLTRESQALMESMGRFNTGGVGAGAATGGAAVQSPNLRVVSGGGETFSTRRRGGSNGASPAAAEAQNPADWEEF